MYNSDQIEIHPLFIGPTRIPMRLGVTVNFLVLSSTIDLLCFLLCKSFKVTILLAIVLYIFGFICCLYDPRIFDLLFGKLKCMNSKNRKYWRCNSYDPF